MDGVITYPPGNSQTAMNEYEQVFSPSLTTSFIRQTFDGSDLSSVKAIDVRHLFYRLNQAERHHQISRLAYNFICYHLNIVSHSYLSLMVDKYEAQKLADLKISSIVALSQQLSTLEHQQECVKQTAAIQLTQPCWLQNISQISCSQNDSAVQIMSIYLNLKGRAENTSNSDELYKSLLLQTGINTPTLYTQAFSEQTDILNEVFNFASIQLALSRFPRLLFPEIMGFTLAFCQMPTLIEVCFPTHQLPTDFFKVRQQQVGKQLKAIQHCMADYIASFPQQKNALWLRIQNGFFLYQQQMLCFRNQFSTRIKNQPTVQQLIAQLFQQKAVAAIGHHQKILIDGVSLDQWFVGMPENCQAFLSALKNSDYIDKNNPEKSRLLKLFDSEGPMLGVLNSTERELLLDWLKNDENTVLLRHSVESLSTKSHSNEAFIAQTVEYTKLNNRVLFYYLVNADLFPDVLLTAQNKVKKLLRFCGFFCRMPFKKYSHEQFDSYIASIYHREISAYKPLQGQPKISKAAYLWGLEQIAPMILIDGCWLQNSLHIENTNLEIAEILFSIYCDEVGNGTVEQNHSYIFQQLLASLSISVPPVNSRQFVNHPAFIDSAFDLPVYMLALSHCSVQFLPELLGLNMAIEISGLGKSYMQLVDDWNYWGIDPRIAQIHISIDNYATGHTFLAKKAIKLYLDQIQQNTADSLMVDKHWRRICCGYASLRFVGTRFKLALPIRYLLAKYFSQHSQYAGH